MIIGGWPFRLPPEPDELLSSVLTRNAHAHGLGAHRFTNLFWPGRAVWNRDVDRTKDEAWIAEIAGRLGLPAERMADCTISPLIEPLAHGAAARHGDIPWLLSAGVFHRLRRRHGLQFCPNCLREAGRGWFRREWRLAFTVACPIHMAGLADACGRCGAPVIPHRTLPGAWGRCHSCQASLASTVTEPADMPAAVVRLQRHLSALLVAKSHPDVMPPSWPDAPFATGRLLMGAVGSVDLYATARRALGLSARPIQHPDRLERSRHADRVAMLEICGSILDGWPDSFRCVAAACGMTQRTFSRVVVPPPLAAEIARLPMGRRNQPRRDSHRDLLALRRLQKRDPAAYRQARAVRLLSAIGSTSARDDRPLGR